MVLGGVAHRRELIPYVLALLNVSSARSHYTSLKLAAVQSTQPLATIRVCLKRNIAFFEVSFRIK
jgi:hypothetical protein